MKTLYTTFINGFLITATYKELVTLINKSKKLHTCRIVKYNKELFDSDLSFLQQLYYL